MYYVRRCVCVCVDARMHACMYMYVGYDVGVSCVAAVIVTNCLWLQLWLQLINLASGSFHVNSTSVFHGPPRIVLKFCTVVEHG